MEPTVAAEKQGRATKLSIKDKKRMLCLLTNVQNTTLSDTLQSRTVAASLTVLTAATVFTSVFLWLENNLKCRGKKTQLIYCHKVPLISYQRLDKTNNISLKSLVEGFVFYSFAPDKREKSSEFKGDTPKNVLTQLVQL